MNEDERKRVGVMIHHIAAYYSKQLEKTVIGYMVDDLEDLPFQSVVNAYNAYRKNPKNLFFPLPAQIRAIVNPTASRESLANEVASRIREAVTKFGYPNFEEAKTFIGPLGVDIIRRQGGWPYVCEQLGVDMNVLTYQAQTREIAKAMIESAELGTYNQPIQIPEKQGQSKLQSFANLITLKDIPK